MIAYKVDQGANTLSACELLIEWQSQNDLPAIKTQNVNAFKKVERAEKKVGPKKRKGSRKAVSLVVVEVTKRTEWSTINLSLFLLPKDTQVI